MRGVLALCTGLLLVAVTAQQGCVEKPRASGVRNVVDANLEKVFDNVGDEESLEEEEEECDCVPYYLCENSTIITNGKGLIDIRINSADTCSDQLEVCCRQASQIVEKVDGTGVNHGQKLPYETTPSSGCGQRNKDGVGFRITGGNAGEAQFGEFPWMAALLVLENGQEVFSGGGSLIHPEVVLTAAHSVYRFKEDPSSLRVRLGEWDTQSAVEIVPHQQLSVREVIVHANYNKGSLHNDIALLVLSNPAQMAENVGTVCLPEQNEVITNSDCLAAGWGKNEFGRAGCYQVILKSIELPIVDSRRCQTLLRKTRLGRRFKLDASFTCAGGQEGIDACKGDGGGPLACPIPGKEDFYQQAGIISWGIGCGETNVPGVYADVAKFRNWIDDMFDERRLDINAYLRPWEGNPSGATN